MSPPVYIPTGATSDKAAFLTVSRYVDTWKFRDAILRA